MASLEALCGKLQKDIDLKSSTAHYYKLWRKETHKIPTASSPNIQAVALDEGDWHTHGAIKTWNYTINGKPEIFKEKVEFNDANMTITCHGIEGDLYNELKFYKLTIKVVPKNNGSVAKLVIEYERLNEDMPIPNNYMDLAVSVVQDIDAHVHGAST